MVRLPLSSWQVVCTASWWDQVGSDTQPYAFVWISPSLPPDMIQFALLCICSTNHYDTDCLLEVFNVNKFYWGVLIGVLNYHSSFWCCDVPFGRWLKLGEPKISECRRNPGFCMMKFKQISVWFYWLCVAGEDSAVLQLKHSRETFLFRREDILELNINANSRKELICLFQIFLDVYICFIWLHQCLSWLHSIDPLKEIKSIEMLSSSWGQ